MHSGTISVTDLWLELNKLCCDIWLEATLHQMNTKLACLSVTLRIEHFQYLQM